MNVESVYLDDVLLWDCADPAASVGLTSENLGSGPEPRTSTDGRPSRDGSVNRTRYWGPRLVELVGYVQGADRAERTATLEALRNAFTLREPHALTFTPAGMAERTLDVVVASRFDAPIEGDPPVIAWSVVLEAPDPRMYGEAHFVSYHPFTDPNVLATNEGAAPVPVVLSLLGSGPGDITAVRNDTTGEEIAFDPVLLIGAGGSRIGELTVDTGAQTVTNEETGFPAPEVLDVSGTIWWELQPGDNLVEVVGTFASDGLVLQVDWRDGWL